MNSRTFGHVINKKREICDAVLTFAQSCSTQLRQEKSEAVTVTVFVYGDRFRQDLPFYSNSCSIRMQSHTSSTIEIVRHAIQAFHTIYKEGYYYRKAGVMVTEIKPANEIQLDIFNAEKEVKHNKLMSAVDIINNRYGTKQVVLAPSLTKGEWAPQQNHHNLQSKTLRFYSGMSPRHTPHLNQRSNDNE